MANALKRRGSLTIWFDPDMVCVPPPTGTRGRQPQYSDAAIQTCLTMKVLFGMALRQTTGFVENLLRLVGLDWSVPDFSRLSRRQKTLAVTIAEQTGPRKAKVALARMLAVTLHATWYTNTPFREEIMA